MFLNLKFTLLLALTVTCMTTHAQDRFFIEPGIYRLESGEKDLCPNFEMSQKASYERNIQIGRIYGFELRNSIHTIESDIDPACEFREQNKREDLTDKTVLTRVNEEYCGGKLRTKTVSRAVVKGDKISVRFELDNAQPIICVWKSDLND